MKPDPAEIKTVLRLLEATPNRLDSLSKGLNKTQLYHRSAEEPWSPNDILAHLRACADVWGQSIKAMISQEHPTLRYISPRTWIRKTEYPEQDFHVSLEAFTTQREGFLKELNALGPGDWSRGATFTATTRGREQTVLSYAQKISRHEDEHCAQIAVLLKTMLV